MVTKPNSVRLIERLEKIEKQLQKQNSYPQNFFRGIAGGIGTAIGVTLIGGIVISILNVFITSIYDIPILNKIIELPVK